jgi:hypothetical protein
MLFPHLLFFHEKDSCPLLNYSLEFQIALCFGKCPISTRETGGNTTRCIPVKKSPPGGTFMT